MDTMLPQLPDVSSINPINWLMKSSGTYEIRGIIFETQYWMAVVIALLIFMLLFTFARIRYLYVHWNLSRSSISFLFWGFILALIVEGFLWIAGRTVLTEVIGWKNAPKPIGTALDIGRGRLVDVLGATEEIPESKASEKANAESIFFDYQSLSAEEASTVRQNICKP